MTPSSGAEAVVGLDGDHGALEQAFDEVNPDQLTPRQALELLYTLKGVATEEGDDGEG